MYKNESITSVLFLIFIIPLIALCQEWIKNLTTIRVAWGLYYSAITIGVSLWFFWRGLQSGNKRESKLTKKNSMGLMPL